MMFRMMTFLLCVSGCAIGLQKPDKPLQASGTVMCEETRAARVAVARDISVTEDAALGMSSATLVELLDRGCAAQVPLVGE